MELTQKQELYISRYMRAVADALAGRLNERQCNRALSRLQSRINEQINATDKARPEDIDVLDALRKMGTPENQADILARVWGGSEAAAVASEPALQRKEERGVRSEGRGEGEEERKSSSDIPPAAQPLPPQVWLGVLAWCATQWDLPAWALRTLAAFLGVITLPMALLVYVGVYFWLRMSGRLPAMSPLRPWRLILRPTITALMLAVIHFTGVYAVKAVYIVYDTWLKRDIPDIGEWAWFESEAGRMFFWVSLVLLPLALFSAMPLANAWDYSLKRLSQACVALYAIVVSFGVASFVAGIILAFVREFTGS